MTHQTMKYPLGNVYHEVMLQVLFIAAWLGIDRLIVKKSAAKTYHGAALLLPGHNSGKYQEVLAAAIVWARGPRTGRSTDPAIFIQKVREWTDYNKAKGKADVRPYYSYQEWCDEHFPCHNEASMQRLVQSLEELGLIVTEQFNSRDLRKRYALNESAITALVNRWSLAFPEIAKKFRGESKGLASESNGASSESSRFASESNGLASARHTSSKKAFKPNAFNQSKTKPTPPQGDQAAAPELQPIPLMEKETTVEHPGLDANASAQERTATASLTSSEVPLSQEGAGIDTPVSKTMTAGDLWGVARHQLCAQDETFKRWLKDAQLRAYTLVDGIGIYKVAVADDHAQQQMQRRYYRNIESVFRGMHNGPMKIEFEVGR